MNFLNPTTYFLHYRIKKVKTGERIKGWVRGGVGGKGEKENEYE